MGKPSSDSSSNVFEGLRGGVRHRYEVRSDALFYSATDSSSPKEVTVPWRELTRIEAGYGEAIYLVRRNKQSFGIWLEAETMRRFCDSALRAWGGQDPETARKAAFDYGASEPAMGWIWLVLALAFPGMLSLLLLTDGYHERACTRLMTEGGITAPAHVEKIKKNRRGNFIWTLKFQTADGRPVTGTREAPLTDETGAPRGSKDTATVVYAPENLSCWDLSLKPGENALDNRQRGFVLFMDLTFGWMFAVIAAVCCVYSAVRIRNRRPFREAVRAAGEKI